MRGALRIRPGGPRAGFSLLELLAVILILGILAAALVRVLGQEEHVVRSKVARTQLAELSAAIDAYERRFGSYPPSRFASEQGSLPNALNLGVEALVVALWSRGYEAGGHYASEDLANVDGDRSTKHLTDFPDNQLFELVDPWGNPIAYVSGVDYGEPQTYLTADGETGELVESEVRARVDATTRRFHRHARFQLLSAGADGLFGTDDDVANFDP